MIHKYGNRADVSFTTTGIISQNPRAQLKPVDYMFIIIKFDVIFVKIRLFPLATGCNKAVLHRHRKISKHCFHLPLTSVLKGTCYFKVVHQNNNSDIIYASTKTADPQICHLLALLL